MELTHFDAAGKPVNLAIRGYSRRVTTYDDQGKVADHEFFTADGKPAVIQLVLYRVDAGTPGEKLGLQAGDVLLTWDGQTLRHYEHFRALRTDQKEPKPLTFRRGGEIKTVIVEPGRIGIFMDEQVLPAP